MDVFNKAKQLDSLGRKIIHMEVGEPDFSPPPQVREELMLIYDKHRYHYTEAAGSIIITSSPGLSSAEKVQKIANLPPTVVTIFSG